MSETIQLSGREGLPEILTTDEAADRLNRRPQTLRKWACLENGPIRPLRINGRLAWRVSDLQAILGGGAPIDPPTSLARKGADVTEHAPERGTRTTAVKNKTRPTEAEPTGVA